MDAGFLNYCLKESVLLVNKRATQTLYPTNQDQKNYNIKQEQTPLVLLKLKDYSPLPYPKKPKPSTE